MFDDECAAPGALDAAGGQRRKRWRCEHESCLQRGGQFTNAENLALKDVSRSTVIKWGNRSAVERLGAWWMGSGRPDVPGQQGEAGGHHHS
jgi:hypothetical protein